MSKIIKVNKSITLKFEDRKINLPNELKENIEKFWKDAVKDNPNLYNGQDYVVEKVNETENKIEMLVVKSDYSHYLYNERVGIQQEKYRCCSPWGGILLLTKDNYFVIGEMNSTTSIPYGLQIAGGGIDVADIENGAINIESNIKRELKEELGVSVEIVFKIGVVSDYYNLIHRHNINNYFLCKVEFFGEKELTEDEINNFHLSTLKLSYEEAIREYEYRSNTRLGKLIANRELPVLHRAKEIIDI